MNNETLTPDLNTSQEVNHTEPQSSQLSEIWPLGLNHSTSKLEKSERARRRNENDNRLLAEFSSFVLDYCQASKMDDAQRAEFSRDVLGFLNDK